MFLSSKSKCQNYRRGEGSENKAQKGEHKFREIFVGNVNPFQEAYNKGSDEEKELIKNSPGSPLYYKDYNSGAYVIAIINENYEFQYFERKTMLFLCDMVNKGKLLRKR